MFTAEVSVGESVLSGVEFVVIENEGHALLGQETAISLGVLKLEAHVNSLEVSTDGAQGEAVIFETSPGFSEGIGKLKDFQLKVQMRWNDIRGCLDQGASFKMLSDVDKEVVNCGGKVRIIRGCVSEELIHVVPILLSRRVMAS